MESTENGGRHRRRRAKTPVAAGVVAAAVMGASFVIYQASSAAFVTNTENHGNTFSTGALTLTDNDSNAAMFTVATMTPGTTGTACITVSYAGSVMPSAPVQLYVAPGDFTDTPGVGGGGTAPSINWAIETVAGSGVWGSGAGCTGLSGTTTVFGNTADTTISAGRMLSDFTTRNAYSATGTTSVSSTWTPAAGTASQVFRFTYRLANDAPNSAMGASVALKITWEARS